MTALGWSTHRARVSEGTLLIEVPEGSWGSFGRSLSAMEITAIAGTDKNAERFNVLKENTAN